MEKENFFCSKHAIINAAADVLHEKKFFIVEINDRSGEIIAEQGLRLSSLGKTILIQIREKNELMEVSVLCENKFGIGIPGVARAIEKSVMNQLRRDL